MRKRSSDDGVRKMPEKKNKKIVIIGGGPGGYVAAIRSAQLGCTTTLIEKDKLGGTCLNRGCIPTKVLLQSAETLMTVKEAKHHGIVTGEASVDFAAVMARKTSVVDGLVRGVHGLMAKNRITVIKGTGIILDSRKVVVKETGKEITADEVIIATGSLSASLPIKGKDSDAVIDSDAALSLTEIPASLVVIGGGVLGLEFAQIFNSFGAKVTVVEMMPQLLPGQDAEIAKILGDILIEQGIEILTGARVVEIQEASEGANKVIIDAGSQKIEKKAQKILVAVGRMPNLEGLGLDGKLQMAKGCIAVNERLETSLSHTYAIGDVVGGMMLAHKAMAEGRCAAENAAEVKGYVNYKAIPGVVYTLPGVGSVGMTEQAAREHYDHIKVGRFPFIGNGKARVLGETAGLIKIISERQYGEILGVHIIGPSATELIAEAVLAIHLEIPIDEFVTSIHAHPTLSEAMNEAALAVTGKTVHL